jgi:uncharacterized RDD family membrane protein YckC
MKRLGFWPRLLASAIDGVLIAAMWIALAFSPWAAIDGAYWAVLLLYTGGEILFAATPGKLILGQRIRRFDGTRAGRWTLIDRWLYRRGGALYWLGFLLIGSPGVQIIAGVWVQMIWIGCFYAFTASRQTWHDRWAHTAVWSAPKGRTQPPPIPA